MANGRVDRDALSEKKAFEPFTEDSEPARIENIFACT